MDTIKKDGPQIDPLRRVFVPIERRLKDGIAVFRTTDKQSYVRRSDGSIRLAERKVRGKAARRADKALRQRAAR